MYLKLRIAAVVCVAALCSAVLGFARRSVAQTAPADNSRIVECRILEAHASTAPAVLVVVFHQRRKQDEPHIEALLTRLSGSAVEVQAADAPWTSATVFRLKSCFGRGLLVMPAGGPVMKAGGTFRIRFPAARSGD